MSEPSSQEPSPNHDPPETSNVAGDQISPDPLLKSGSFIHANIDPHPGQNDVLDAGEPRRSVPDGSEPDNRSHPTVETPSTAEAPPPQRRPRRSPEELAAERPEWLPEGWVMTCRVRTTGQTAGSMDRDKATTRSVSSCRPKRGRKQASLSAALLERPEWLPEGWLFNPRIRSSGSTAGHIDRYYIEPVTGHQFRSKNEVLHFLETGSRRKKKANSDTDAMPSESPGTHGQKNSSSKKKKKMAPINFDFKHPPNEVVWVLTDGPDQKWSPIVGDEKVPESSKEEWATVFSHITQQAKSDTLIG